MIKQDVLDLISTYSTESGKKEVERMLREGKVFEPITSTQDLDIHNYVTRRLRKLGFNAGNFKEIVDFVLRLPIKESKNEGEEVISAYLGVEDDLFID